MECHSICIVEKGIALLLTAHMPITLWLYPIQITTFFINILPTKIPFGLYPFEVLQGKASIYDALKFFGHYRFPYMRDFNHNNFDTRFVECALMGYALNQKRYLCLNKSIGKVTMSKHMVFH